VNTRRAPVSPGQVSPAHRPHVLAIALVRPLLTVVALVVAYFMLPVDRELNAGTLVALIIGLCLVVVVIIWETRAILRSRYPALQGIQALAFVAPLFLLVFANAYYVLAHNLPASFTAPMSRTDSLYFVVTVFATVGFGDIAPVTQTARILVTAQMVGNLLLVGIALRVILTAVERSRDRR
jgi:voltage-gated potassium channel